MITVPEAARRLRRHPETIRRWIRSGRLRSEKVGTQHLVRESDLEMFRDHEPLDLPEHWMQDDEGDEIPDWEGLVRDGRSSH